MDFMASDAAKPSGAQAPVEADDCPLCGGTRAHHLFTKKGYELVRCDGCDLVRISPMPTAAELQKIYSFEAGYHQNFADDESERQKRRRAAENQLRFAQEYTRRGRLLDVGASAGFFIGAAAEAGWEAEGVELSADTAAEARARTGLTVHTGQLTDLDLPEASYDLITMWDVIEHLLDPLEAAHRVRELLKPDGRFILETPNEGGLFPRVSYAASKVADFWPHPEPPHHVVQFSVKTITDLLDRAGFEVETLVTRGIPVGYSLSGLTKEHFKLSPFTLYCAAMAPFALAGPKIGMGDTMRIVARPREV